MIKFSDKIKFITISYLLRWNYVMLVYTVFIMTKLVQFFFVDDPITFFKYLLAKIIRIYTYIYIYIANLYNEVNHEVID